MEESINTELQETRKKLIELEHIANIMSERWVNAMNENLVLEIKLRNVQGALLPMS